jgi:hypothetical protein
MVPAVSLFRWVGAPAGPNASIDRHGPWRRNERGMGEGMMTADGWIRNEAVSEVECKVRQDGPEIIVETLSTTIYWPTPRGQAGRLD